MKRLKRRFSNLILTIFAIPVFISGCAPGLPPPPIVGGTGFFVIGWIIIALIALIVVVLWKRNNSREQQNEDKYLINSINDISRRLNNLEETIENLIRNKKKKQ